MGFFKDKFGAPTPEEQNVGVGVEKVEKPDLSTSEGLRAFAETVGVGERAEKILAEKGEDPERIFSGGFIQDSFDTLNLLQHGVVGTVKGTGFKEGVKTRQSFTQKDALGDFGIPGLVAGTAMDIALDPLTYIPIVGLFKAATKIPKVAKAVKATKEVAKQSYVGDFLGRNFVYRFGQDPIYKNLAERNIRNIGIGNQNLLDIARPLTKLSGKDQRIIADARKAGKIDELPEELLERAREPFQELDRLGSEAVEQGLLDAKTYDENVGSYLARLYRMKKSLIMLLKK